MNTTEVRFPITDLAGASCAGRVEQELPGLTGVARASVDPARALDTIGYDPARSGLDDLRAAIRLAGGGRAYWERAALRIRAAESRR